MHHIPIVVEAQHRGGFAIHVRFNDAVEATLDFRPWLKGPVFEDVREPAYFARFFLDGGTVAWPNGADVAPEALYEAALAVNPPGSKQQSMVLREPRTPYRSRRKSRR